MSESGQLAVIDLGSNSFRLVVFTSPSRTRPAAWWRRTDEIHEAVRIGEGLDEAGTLGRGADGARARDARAVRALLPRDRRRGRPARRDVRDPRRRQPGRVPARRARAQRAARCAVLSREEEARYGYLAAVNSTTLADGVALDLGGGSMQLTRVDEPARDRHALLAARRRAHDRALPARRRAPRASSSRRCARTSPSELEAADWLRARRAARRASAARCATSPQPRSSPPSCRPTASRASRSRAPRSTSSSSELAELPAAERASVPGIKPARGDLILAGAVVVQSVMEAGDFEALEVTEAGLREGVFYETLLGGSDPPLFEDVRRASVLNLAAPTARTSRTPTTSPGSRWSSGTRSPQRRPARRRPARARPAVGGGDAARHRHGRRLRRPPQALALPDPQRRACRATPRARPA